MRAREQLVMLQAWTHAGKSGASSAIFSSCGAYRYELRRSWDPTRPVMISIGLNPSTADAYRDDHTIRKEVAFAGIFGCGAYIKLNIFGFRSTDYRALYAVKDPVGPENDETIERVLRAHPRAKLLLTWGVPGSLAGRGAEIGALALKIHGAPECFGFASNGEPLHPLRLPYRQAVVPWRAPADIGARP